MGVHADAACVSEAWAALIGALGLTGTAAGQRVNTSAGAPPLAGIVAHAGPSEHPELLLRIEEPAPGIAHLFALPMGQVYLPVRTYLFGDRAPAAVARDEPAWRTWMDQHFPAAVAAAP
jgi:hypothetical protein